MEYGSRTTWQPSWAHLVWLLCLSCHVDAQGIFGSDRIPIEFSTDEGTFLSIDISPDGANVVFALLGDIYRLPIAGGNATALTQGPAYDEHPRFSPDGLSIVFVSDQDGASNLWLMDPGGGNHRKLTNEVADGHARYVYFTPTWSPHGESIIAHRFRIFEYEDRRLYEIFLDGRETRTIHMPDEEPIRAEHSPAVSPDGRFIYFTSAKCKSLEYQVLLPCQQIGVYDQRHETLAEITHASGGAATPVLSPDGRWLVYSSRSGPDAGLKVRDRVTQSERWLVFPTERDLQEGYIEGGVTPGAAFSPDSTFLVAAFRGGIWRIDVPGGAVTRIPFKAAVRQKVAKPLMFENDPDYGSDYASYVAHPAPSPDGRSILFEALNSIWRFDVTSGVTRKVVEQQGAIQRSPAWSPDGNRIAWFSWQEGPGGHLYEIDADDPSSARRLTDIDGFYASPVYSSDGRNLFYLKALISDELSYASTFEIHKLAASPDAATYLGQVRARKEYGGLRGSLPQLFVSPDSADVYFYDQADAGLVSLNAETGRKCGHFKLAFDGINYEEVGADFDLVISPDMSRAIATINVDTYLLDLGGIDWTSCESTKIVLNDDDAAIGAIRLNEAGSTFQAWSRDTGSAYLQLGRTIYEYTDEQLTELRPASSIQDAQTRIEPAEQVIRIPIESADADDTIVLKNARLLTMSDAGVIERGDIVVTGDRIVAVGESGTVTVPPGAKQLDLGGKTILPGFVNSHCHTGSTQLADTTVPGRHQPWELLNSLAYGVTTCAELWATFSAYAGRDLLHAGEIIGPRLLLFGRPSTWAATIRNESDASAHLRRNGADGFPTQYAKQYVVGTRQRQLWYLDAARETEKTVIAEGFTVGYDLSNVIDGIGGLAHSIAVPFFHDDVQQLLLRTGTALHLQMAAVPWNHGVTETKSYFLTTVDRDLIADTKARRFWPSPSLRRQLSRHIYIHPSEHVFPEVTRALGEFVDAGGTIAIGDHGEFGGMGLHWDIWTLAAGMGAGKALKAATRLGAESLGLGHVLGSLEAGKMADLLVLERNPLEDIYATRSLQFVMVDGLLYEADTLDRRWPDERALPEQWFWHLEPRAVSPPRNDPDFDRTRAAIPLGGGR